MFTIVSATPDSDFRAVAQLYYDTWQQSYRGMIPQGFLDLLTPATWHPERRQANTLLALVSNRIVGVCSYGPARYLEYRSFGEVYSLYVHPSMQHQGIGRALLKSALKRLDARYEACYLVVLTQNFNAIALYESQGFCMTDDRRSEVTQFGTLDEVVLGRRSEFI